MIATKTYSAMLYALADDIRYNNPIVTDAENVEEAAERLDLQTVKINVLKDQHEHLLTALEAAVQWAAPMAEAPVDARPNWFDLSRRAIARVKSYGQPEKQAKTETSVPAIVFFPAGSLGEEVEP